MKTTSSLTQLCPEDQHRYRMLPFFGRIIERFTYWCLDRCFRPLTVRTHLAGLRRLESWFRAKQKRRPEDLSAQEINQAYRFYRYRRPFCARAILAFGDFLQAIDCLKPAPALCRIKPRAHWRYLALPIFGISSMILLLGHWVVGILLRPRLSTLRPCDGSCLGFAAGANTPLSI